MYWIQYPECLSYEHAYSEDHIVCSGCAKAFNILDNRCEDWKYCPNCGEREEKPLKYVEQVKNSSDFIRSRFQKKV